MSAGSTHLYTNLLLLYSSLNIFTEDFVGGQEIIKILLNGYWLCIIDHIWSISILSMWLIEIREFQILENL